MQINIYLNVFGSLQEFFFRQLRGLVKIKATIKPVMAIFAGYFTLQYLVMEECLPNLVDALYTFLYFWFSIIYLYIIILIYTYICLFNNKSQKIEEKGTYIYIKTIL
jgi:hypothetical protein